MKTQMAKTRKEQFLYPHDLIEELDSRLHALFKHGFLGGRGDSTVEIDKTSDEHIDELIEWICKEHILNFKVMLEIEWVMCNDFLPSDKQKVLFTTDFEDVIPTVKYGTFYEGDEFIKRGFYMNCFDVVEVEDVTAWMPLPKPYQPDAEEDA